ncbi:hypothetical protein HAP47_0018805 [Bradyrhizobium sp. 41S5]|uniref:hypothetical protein n=1 Tax=Bradyrhizobium sp. 41S5 TaxID=1404443 RepID=UPI00156BB13D|nr:hypothetical protein [Bradyrhizobium sp. 41S5]UFX48596.1 hypothetical protein HAP47_0018805 [Bradyrhizobium sp. 41S5]
MRVLKRLPAERTKDRAKLEAMRRPGGARQHELQEIDGNGGYGTYKNDGARYAAFLALELKISGSGTNRLYRLVQPEILN